MSKLSDDFKTGMLGAVGGLFTSSVFLLIERINSYHSYLSRLEETDYADYTGVVDNLWWIPVSFWHVAMFVTISFLVHRYLADRWRSPFLLWQMSGFVVLLGWMLTFSVAVVLDYLMRGNMDSLGREINSQSLWYVGKFVSAIFASNVAYGSVMQIAAGKYAKSQSDYLDVSEA